MVNATLPASSHEHEFQSWLQAAGLDPASMIRSCIRSQEGSVAHRPTGNRLTVETKQGRAVDSTDQGDLDVSTH